VEVRRTYYVGSDLAAGNSVHCNHICGIGGFWEARETCGVVNWMRWGVRRWKGMFGGACGPAHEGLKMTKRLSHRLATIVTLGLAMSRGLNLGCRNIDASLSF
jgi:hypothetical protein